MEVNERLNGLYECDYCINVLSYHTLTGERGRVSSEGVDEADS